MSSSFQKPIAEMTNLETGHKEFCDRSSGAQREAQGEGAGSPNNELREGQDTEAPPKP